jgi:hypothetical protein
VSLANHSVYAKIALFGVALYLLTALLFFVAVIISEPADVAFILFLVIPALIVAAAIYFIRPWGLIVGILGGIFGLTFFSEDVDLILGTPQSFFDFTGQVIGMTGLIVIIVASAIGLIQHFRHADRTELSPTDRRILQGIAGVLAIVAVISAVLTVTNIGGVSAEEEQNATVIEAKKTAWEPEQVTISGSNRRLVIKNRDPFLHTFTIYDLDIDERLSPGSETVIELPSSATGVIPFVCRLFDHELDMTGAITIR